MAFRLLGDAGLESTFYGVTAEVVGALLISTSRERAGFSRPKLREAMKIFASKSQYPSSAGFCRDTSNRSNDERYPLWQYRLVVTIRPLNEYAIIRPSDSSHWDGRVFRRGCGPDVQKVSF
jgi:hypothetical protein